MVVCSQSTIKPTCRSSLYVTELLHRVQNQYTKAISFASMIEMRSPIPRQKLAPAGGECPAIFLLGRWALCF